MQRILQCSRLKFLFGSESFAFVKERAEIGRKVHDFLKKFVLVRIFKEWLLCPPTLQNKLKIMVVLILRQLTNFGQARQPGTSAASPRAGLGRYKRLRES